MKRILEWLPFFLAVMIALTTLTVRFLRDCERKCGSCDDSENVSLILVTGYCNCGKCCGWRRNWFGFGEPVYDYGKTRGIPKKVGITASGTKARHGTIAADPKIFPLGTHLHVPGYGSGTVEDVGESIRGRHIDIWFPTHAEAREWGSRRLKVRRVR